MKHCGQTNTKTFKKFQTETIIFKTRFESWKSSKDLKKKFRSQRKSEHIQGPRRKSNLLAIDKWSFIFPMNGRIDGWQSTAWPVNVFKFWQFFNMLDYIVATTVQSRRMREYNNIVKLSAIRNNRPMALYNRC